LPDKEIIQYQLDLITQELSDVSPLLDKIAAAVPDQIEVRALAAVFQSIYNGSEIILQQLVEIKDSSPKTWHKNLLDEALRLDVISEDFYIILDQFRRFRHKFRHSYGYTLDWDMMEPLYKMIPNLVSELKIIVREELDNE